MPSSVEQLETEQEQIHFWEARLRSAMERKEFKEHQKDKQEARRFYDGEEFTQNEIDAWGGDMVQGNLYRRHVEFMTNAVYATDPAIRCAASRRAKGDPNFMAHCSVWENHVKYTYDEMDLGAEVRCTWKDSNFGNFSVAKIELDRERGLWTARFVPGAFIADPDAHGDLRRARWVAECVQLPRYRVWQNSTYDADSRADFRERYVSGGEGVSPESYDEEEDGEEERTQRSDIVTLWYIYTKEGIMPHQSETDKPEIRLLVYAENFDRWLYNAENPCPYLNNDEFPYAVMRMEQKPGELYGPAYWRQVKGICKSFNWAVSFHMEDMRQTAGRKLAYDQDRIDDPTALEAADNQVYIPTNGSPRDAVFPIDRGQADKTIFDSVQFFKDMLDRVTGIDDIARGEEGRTKTATESQILQENSNIALKGPGASLDAFIRDLIRKVGLASLYYIPRFSVYINQQGIPVTRQVNQVPMFDQMSNTFAIDPATGMPAMQDELAEVPVQFGPEEYEQYGLDPEQPAVDRVDEYLVKGIDYFHGDEAAMRVLDIDFEQVKNEMMFTIEAGSTRAARRLEKQRNAQMMLKTVGMEMRMLGLNEEYYENLAAVVDSFEVSDKDKVFPSKEKFLMHIQQQQMLMASGALGADPATGGAGAADPNAFGQSKNEGKDFPLEEGSGT